MVSIIGQINLGRGKAAREVLEKVIKERKWEIVLVQEHCKKGRKFEGYRKVENGDKGKTLILVKEEIQIIEQRR